MAKKRNREEREPKRGALDERRRLIAAGSLSTAVVSVLMIGAVLRTDAPFAETTVPVSEPTTTTARVTEARLPEAPEPTRGPQPRTSPEPVPTPDPPAPREPRPGSLAARASEDRDRMIGSDGRYTLQLMVSCDPDNARRNLEDIGNTSRLYVIPVDLDGRACYRLCWGVYPTRESAESVSDLPAPFDSPRVQLVAELTR